MMDISAYIQQLQPRRLQGQAYYRWLRAFSKMHAYAMADELPKGALALGDVIGICLRYRLNLAAGFEILEDVNAIPSGTYISLRNRRMRPSDLIRQYIETHGWPDAAPAIVQEAR